MNTFLSMPLENGQVLRPIQLKILISRLLHELHTWPYGSSQLLFRLAQMPLCCKLRADLQLFPPQISKKVSACHINRIWTSGVVDLKKYMHTELCPKSITNIKLWVCFIVFVYHCITTTCFKNADRFKSAKWLTLFLFKEIRHSSFLVLSQQS